MCAFRTSDNKDVIRTSWNLPVLQAWHEDTARKLAYFGLTGPEMLDVIAWREVLKVWTAVEERPRNNPEKRALADLAAQEIVLTATRNDLDDGLELLRGSVEDVILEAMDENGIRPPMADTRAAHLCNFHYDLYNLDFDGGLGFASSTGRPRRVRALEALFRRQQGNSFILFLTVNVRDTLRPKVAEFLTALGSEGSKEQLDWYAARQDGQYEYQLKAAIPLFLRHHAEVCGFDSSFWPPLAYEGHERARMVHFVCLFKHTGALFKAFSSQTRDQVIALPLVRCAGGNLALAHVQHPGFDANACSLSLTYLPRDCHSKLFSSEAK